MVQTYICLPLSFSRARLPSPSHLLHIDDGRLHNSCPCILATSNQLLPMLSTSSPSLQSLLPRVIPIPKLIKSAAQSKCYRDHAHHILAPPVSGVHF